MQPGNSWAHTFNPSTWEVKKADLCESEVNLVYRVSSRTTRVIQWNPVLRKIKITKKKKKAKWWWHVPLIPALRRQKQADLTNKQTNKQKDLNKNAQSGDISFEVHTDYLLLVYITVLSCWSVCLCLCACVLMHNLYINFFKNKYSFYLISPLFA